MSDRDDPPSTPGPRRDAGGARGTAVSGLIWRRGRTLVLLLVVAMTGLRIWDPTPVAAVRAALFDVYQRVAPKPPPAAPVIVVNIDEASLARFGQWPWPRARLAQLVSASAKLGARVVGFNILLPDADRMAPDNLLRSLPDLPAPAAQAVLRMPSGDETLAASFAQVPVILGLAVDGRLGRSAWWAPPATGPAAPFAANGNFIGFLYPYTRMLANLPPLTAAAAGTGVVAVTPGESGTVRDAPIAVRFGSQAIPSLAAEMVRVGGGGAPLHLDVSTLGIERIQGPGGWVRTDRSGNLQLAYSRVDRSRYISAADLLAGGMPADAFRDQYVLIGTTASGIADLHATPLGTQMPGLEIQAQILAALLTGNVLYRPTWVGPAEIGFPLAVAFIGLYLARRRRLGHFAVLTCLAAAAWVPAAVLAYAWRGVLVDPVYPAVTALLVGVLMVATELVVARRAAEQTVSEREARLQELQVELLGLSRLAAVEQMSSALAHELNQPLAAISNFVQASRRLLGNPAPGQTEKIGGYLEKAVGQVERAAAIVVGLRNLVQRGETVRAPEDVNETVREAVETAFIGVPARSVAIGYRLAKGLPRVPMNRIQIQQVILNLVRNATEAMRQQPDAALSVATALLPNGGVEVAIADNGPGLAPGFEDRLFKPFATTKQDGMGIGLSISRSIIEAHGGELTATRNDERGMRFSFTLPPAEPPA